VTISVDNTPPLITVLIPSSGAALNGSTYLDAAATDKVGVTKVQFVLTGGTLSHSVLGTAVPTIYGYLYQFNSASVPNDSYTLQSVACDAAGNAGSRAGVTVSAGN
jgi:leucyl aminopeptidase